MKEMFSNTNLSCVPTHLGEERPASPSSARLSPDLEEDYLDSLKPLSLRAMRTWLSVSVVLGLAMVWNVARGDASAARGSLLLELGFHLPLALVAGVWLSRARSMWFREGTFIAAGLGGIACIAMEGDLAPPDYPIRYLMLAAMTLFSAAALVPLRPRSAMCFALLGFAATLANTLEYGGQVAGGSGDVLVFTGLLTVLGLRARVSIDGERRRNHVLRMQDQLHGTELARSNARLLELSDTDSLTGVGNRRSFERTLDRLVHTSGGENLALVMLDVDHFKQFNDTYGHPCGDECLKLVARTLREQVRDVHDHVARYGGEEFAVVLPNASIGVAMEVAERMRVAVGALQLAHLGRPKPPLLVTISIGVASVVVTGNAVRQILIANADSALYAAKMAGRDLVWCHEEASSTAS